VLVQGDTTTVAAAALAAFYARAHVGHVEAGLRTYNRYSPWPEEVNRRIISVIATRHYAPTTVSRDQLLHEAFPSEDILVTGNTVIDALLHTAERLDRDASLRARAEKEFSFLDSSRRLVLVTGHRRENFGGGLEQICEALDKLAARGDIEIVYPVHLNPNVQTAVRGVLRDRPNIHLIEPQSYAMFVWLMKRATIILSDSGGVQEEAPSLGKPVLVMRDTSERPEAISAGTCLLVGTSTQSIVESANGLLDNPTRYELMSRRANPYGDGTAGHKIIEDLIACRR
jgi:UDP-N-acetylglucosamine 2-epimerase (non-hydrolysing)